jgi:hypothetical protein
MLFNYQEICEDVLTDLPERTSAILKRRFGLKEGWKKETLQNIARDYGLTRERVRQIQLLGLKKARERAKRHQPVFDFFGNQLRTFGNFRRENALLKILSPESFANHVFFLLFLSDKFERFLENEDFYVSWAGNRRVVNLAQETVNRFVDDLEKINRPLALKEIKPPIRLEITTLFAFLEASKKISRGPRGFWGLNVWPEINPRNTREKAYIVFKKEGRPLHFEEAAKLIGDSGLFASPKKICSQTVHNELIKDERFVLIGRGIYSLAEWGYQPGTVKEVIAAVLKENKKGLDQQEVVDRVLRQRMVKESTVLLNLRDKNRFRRNLTGRYQLAAL